MTARRLAIVSIVCAAVAFPAFMLGEDVGSHIGYDAGAETAVIAAGTAGVLSVVFGVAAAIRGARWLAVVGVIAAVVVMGLVVWLATRLIGNME